MNHDFFSSKNLIVNWERLLILGVSNYTILATYEMTNLDRFRFLT